MRDFSKPDASAGMVAPGRRGQLLRAEPFRLFFPLAFLLGIVGVAHWVLFTTGLISHYLRRFHGVTQTQSFLLAFAAGFLCTAIPKRTRTAPATWLELGALLVLLPVVSLATLFEYDGIGQAAYAAALLTLAQFAVRRFFDVGPGHPIALGSAGPRRPPASFAMVPVGLLAGLVGAAASIVGRGAASNWALMLGERLTFEGVFICLALGVGAFFLPLAGRGEAAPDVGPGRGWHAVAYAAAAGGVIVSLFAQAGGWPRAGAGLRGAIALAVLVASGTWRPPTRPGTNRRLLWMAMWAIPVGLFGAASFPGVRVEALHVMFVGGFGVLAFSVATHVTFGHTGQEARQGARAWPVAAFGLLFAVAMMFRISALADPNSYFRSLGIAASVWLLGTIVWAAYVLPSILRAPAPPTTTTSPSAHVSSSP